MPNPKHKHSKARRNSRAAHYKLRAPTFGPCPHCHKPKPPHRVCPHCGYYAGREVVKLEEA
jgi:large subunit ribosomal protein L32